MTKFIAVLTLAAALFTVGCKHDKAAQKTDPNAPPPPVQGPPP